MRARATSLCLCGKPVTYIYIINNGTSYKNVESFVPNVKQVLFLNGSVVLLFCCFLKTCFSRKRLDALLRCLPCVRGLIIDLIRY